MLKRLGMFAYKHAENITKLRKYPKVQTEISFLFSVLPDLKYFLSLKNVSRQFCYMKFLPRTKVIGSDEFTDVCFVMHFQIYALIPVILMIFYEL